MENNTRNGNIEMNEVTLKDQLNGDIPSHMHTNGHNERSDLVSPLKVEINHEGLLHENTTSPDLRHLSSNVGTVASTDVSIN